MRCVIVRGKGGEKKKQREKGKSKNHKQERGVGAVREA